MFPPRRPPEASLGQESPPLKRNIVAPASAKAGYPAVPRRPCRIDRKVEAVGYLIGVVRVGAKGQWHVLVE